MGPWCAQAGAGWIGTTLVWIVAVVVVVWLVSRLFPDARGRDPRTALDRRLAEGRLDPEEYRRLRAALDGVDAGVVAGETPDQPSPMR